MAKDSMHDCDYNTGWMAGCGEVSDAERDDDTDPTAIRIGVAPRDARTNKFNKKQDVMTGDTN